MSKPRIWTAKEAEALRKAATRGPWRLFRDRGFGQWVVAQKRVDCGWSGVVTEYNFRRADGRMIAAAPDLAASVVHHARRADEAERQRDHLAAMLVQRTRDAHRWQFMAAGAEAPSTALLTAWWRDSADRDALVQMLGADVIERAEVSRD